MSAMDTSVFDTCSFTHQFKLNFKETKKAAIGKPVSSGDISDGGHLWTINCYPRGEKKDYDGEYLSVFLHHESKTKDAKAIFEVFVMDRDGAPSSSHKRRLVRVFTTKGTSHDSWGWSHLVKRSELESLYLTNGSVIVMCGVKVVRDDTISVPPSDIKTHLGILLDSTDGSDVSFLVDGEEFPAHRAVLAARSPVFKAQLLGSMADAKMQSITLHDIVPTAFRLMLGFIYTDNLSSGDGCGCPPAETFRDLLAVTDRYALDRLKLMCARRLWDDVSTDTVCATLACAETYNCPELKTKCLDFFADQKNFTEAVLTDGFVELVQKFPAIRAELRAKVVGYRSHRT
ncbi:hypothetical protein HU200_065805 [Digitaria exilis]|uniref:Uncharacterized protein n=1 Tax=Digitaria exilis TaxID=1010633 RepID=A0A835DXM6_9POAL|nr:hypothetical protein HU200_065805 [Digitaria exilis]CAB3483564.1 unnamed protein product [Digitaria exilis]